MKLVFAAIMNPPRYLLDSIIARKVSAPEFSHSLDPKRKSNPTAASYRFSATTVIRSRPPIRLYDRFAPLLGAYGHKQTTAVAIIGRR